MAVKNTAQVLIGGKVYTLGGYESEEYFRKVAFYMDTKIREFNEISGYSRLPMENKHLLLSLNIADDYFKAKGQAESFEMDLQEKDQELYELKHELISLRMELEKTQAKLKGLTDENDRSGKNRK